MNNIQFNLVPDSKLSHVQSGREQKLVLRLGFLAAAALVGVFVLLLLTVYGVQKKQLSDANNAIAENNKKLTSVKNLDQILTVQNQLPTLTNLHSNKHISSRLSNYLTVVTPTNIHIGTVTLDLSGNVLTISGTSDSQHSVNVFVDTLKFTTYNAGSQTGKKAFPSVVESSFGISSGIASYEIKVQVDPTLFANTLTDSEGHHVSPQLVVPSLTTTRSAIDDPSNSLFNGQNTEIKR
ncbi:MAG TPA: hypothetical protein VFB03_02760 [Candidatus Saccharimonadales bacterium]|nr:hypothetical protein [Candidatus Saccharimonadales bacterium]